MTETPGKWKIKVGRWENGYLIQTFLYFDNRYQAVEELEKRGWPGDVPEFVTLFDLIKETVT